VRYGRAVARDDPAIVGAPCDVMERLIELIDRAESLQPEQLLLQHADESLDAAVAIQLPDKGWARLDVEGPNLVRESVRYELAAVVVAELSVLRDPDIVAYLHEAHGLTEAFADEEVRRGDPADLGEKLVVGEECLRATRGRNPRHGDQLRLVALDGGAGEPPRSANAQDAVALRRGGGDIVRLTAMASVAEDGGRLPGSRYSSRGDRSAWATRRPGPSNCG
jgi:hypothetical protein